MYFTLVYMVYKHFYLYIHKSPITLTEWLMYDIITISCAFTCVYEMRLKYIICPYVCLC